MSGPSLTCNSLLMASLYSLALFSSSANISTCAVRANAGDVNRSGGEASVGRHRGRGISCRVFATGHRNLAYPLAHHRPHRTRSRIALIHILAHAVRSHPSDWGAIRRRDILCLSTPGERAFVKAVELVGTGLDQN